MHSNTQKRFCQSTAYTSSAEATAVAARPVPLSCGEKDPVINFLLFRACCGQKLLAWWDPGPAGANAVGACCSTSQQAGRQSACLIRGQCLCECI
jgi:hypothetical protein